MADPRDQDPNATPTPREEQVARNVGADPTDPHESPANPDNRISVSRRAADAENAQQIIENAPETLTGVKPGARPTSRMSQRRRVGKNVVEVPITFVEREIGDSKMDGDVVRESMARITGWGVAHRRQQLRRLVDREPTWHRL